MNLHLQEISRGVAPGAHAALIFDGAGWHTTDKLKSCCPEHHPVWLPPYAPELNPTENIWEYLRKNYLALRVFDDYDAIVDAYPGGTENDTLRTILHPRGLAGAHSLDTTRPPDPRVHLHPIHPPRLPVRATLTEGYTRSHFGPPQPDQPAASVGDYCAAVLNLQEISRGSPPAPMPRSRWHTTDKLELAREHHSRLDSRSS